MNPFRCKNFEIYDLDNYSVSRAEGIKNALLDKGDVPITMAGGTIGDIQVNDTHWYSPLKSDRVCK